jgi:DegV family protein with EDD domain
MVRIVSDSSTLYSSAQAREAGFAVSPLSVTIADRSYREFDEISSDEFVAIIRQGHMPTSSQPAIGEVTALYEEFAGEQILNIAMAQGLSGTYMSAVAAADLCDNADEITVVNSRTLCGPHRYMVEKAVEMAKNGATLQELLAWLNPRIDTAKSFLIPADFDYLRRGGRLSPLVSHVGKMVGLSPVMTQTEDGTRLTVAGIRRGFKHAVKYCVEYLQKQGIGKGWKVYISHAAAPEKAETAIEMLRAAMPGAEYEIVPLSPAFITQGGPGCMAIQYVQL